MVLILLLSVPFLPWVKHETSKQERYEEAEPDNYPGESGVPSGVEDKTWDDLSYEERQDFLDNWKSNVPSWLRELLEPQADLDADGKPNIEDSDIDGDGIPNEEDTNPVKKESGRYDYVNIDNFYDGKNEDELNEIVFRIWPSSPARYWKVRSFEKYDRTSGGGNRWSSEITELKNSNNYEPEVYDYIDREEYSYNLIFEERSNENDYIPTSLHAIKVYNTNPVETEIKVNTEGSFYTKEALKSYSFDVYQYTFSLDELKKINLTKSIKKELEDYLELPDYFEDKSRKEYKVRELALSITENMSSQYEKSMALVAYLKKNYLYNFRATPTPPGEDPVYWFLFERKEGTCANFASAFVILARLNSIPARLAAGFALGTVEDDQRVVRQNNAHAWAEVFFGEMGWIPFEPTSSNVAWDGESGGENQGVDTSVQGGGDGGGSTTGDEADTDGDEIPDWEEVMDGTDPNDNDTDDDGLGDGFEKYVLHSNPLSKDSDGDKLLDGYEYFNSKTSLTDADTDEDGISDFNETVGFEFKLGNEDNFEWVFTTTDPNKWDSDDDGLHDGLEIGLYYPQTNDTVVDVSATPHFYPDLDPSTTTHPMLADTDGDGLTDGEEDKNKNGRYDGPSSRGEYQGETDPTNSDTDGGGASDGDEVSAGGDPTSGDDDAAYMDTDGDGLKDAEEINGWDITYRNERGEVVTYHTTSNISNPDTDGDGLSDYQEIMREGGKKPTDPARNDTDGDGLLDGNERWVVTIKRKGGEEKRNVEANPLAYNSDTDGLSDYQEFLLGTDPRSNDTDGDNPPGEYILDDHLDPEPTEALYEYINTTVEIQVNKNNVWKIKESLFINGKVRGWKNETEVLAVGVKVKLFLSETFKNSEKLTLSTFTTDSQGTFSYTTNLSDIPPGFYTIWAEVKKTYTGREQYNSSISNFINITLSAETKIVIECSSSVENKSELVVTAKLFDKGELPISLENLNLSFFWKGEMLGNGSLNQKGEARYVFFVEETAGEYYKLKVEFSGYTALHTYPAQDKMNYTLTSSFAYKYIKVLSTKVWLNVTAPDLIPVNQSFEIRGNITAFVRGEMEDLSGREIYAVLDNKEIGRGTIQPDSNFSFICHFNEKSTRPGNNTIVVIFPGTENIAEKWFYHKLNIAGLSTLEVRAPEVVERPENITIKGKLVDNRGEPIKGHTVEFHSDTLTATSSSCITDGKGNFRFYLTIPATHLLGRFSYTLIYKGYGYFGENNSNKDRNVVSYFPTYWNGSLKIIAPLSLYLNRTVFVRAEENLVSLRAYSVGNTTIVEGLTLSMYLNGKFIGEATTEKNGTVESTVLIPSEISPGTATFSVEFSGFQYIRDSHLHTTIKIFTRTTIVLNSGTYFRPLQGEKTIIFKGRVENTSEPLSPILLSFYKSKTEEFPSPESGNTLTFPEDFEFLGSTFTDYTGNFTMTTSLKEKASPGRSFFYILFNGSNFYYPSKKLIFLDIMANTTFLFESSTTAIIGKEMSLSLLLLDDLNNPLEGKEVKVIYIPDKDGIKTRSQNTSEEVTLTKAYSDRAGRLSLTLLIPETIPKGERRFIIRFEGDNFYAPTSYLFSTVVYMESKFALKLYDSKGKEIVPKQSTAEFEKRDEVFKGEEINCEIRLLDMKNDAIAYKKVEIYINENFYKSVYLDENGSYRFRIRVEKEMSGSFVIQLIYKGGSDVIPTSTRVDVTVKEKDKEAGFSLAATFLLFSTLFIGLLAVFFYMNRSYKKGEKKSGREKEKVENNRDIIFREYRNFVDFMKYYGYEIGPGTTPREIIKKSDGSVLVSQDELLQITEIFERARYRKEEEPSDEDVEKIKNLIQKIEEDIELENVPLKIGKRKFGYIIFDSMHGFYTRIVDFLDAHLRKGED